MSISRNVLAKYITPGITVFLESGSRWGDTLIRAIECGAVRAIGCDNDPLYAGLAEAHLNEACRNGNAHVFNQDSALFLEAEPTHPGKDIVVFLDAHSPTSSPVLRELQAISEWEHKPRVILIDDIRCMHEWGISIGNIHMRLGEMGYLLSKEDGIEPGDILVASI